MKDIPFHPLAEELPLMPASDLGRMEEGMRRGGFDARFPVVLYQKKILDGRNRFLAAKAAGVKPVFVTFRGTEDAARRFVQMANEERRHLAADWLQRRRQERIERVAAARVEGKSLPAIADEEDISVAQVQRDLEKASGLPGGKPEPESGKVVGKDGRAYPATKPPVLCDRCKRVAPGRGNPGCNACAELRGEKATPPPETNGTPAKRGPKKARPEREPGDDTEEIRRGRREEKDHTRDREGHPVPEQLAAPFANLALFEDLDSLVRKLQKGIDELSRLPGGEGLRHDLQATGEEGKTVNKSEHVNALKRDLNGRRPHSVCPYCQGKAAKACKGCGGLGWVTRTTWRDAAADVKARLG